jgi:hypothetical protein
MAQRKFLIDGGFSVNNDSEITGNLTMTGHILPSVDSDGTTGYDLGSTAAKWRDLYLSQGSLYINNQKVLEDDSGTIIVRADADQSLTIKTEGTGVMTWQSPNPLAIAATLQMAAGKKITDAAGTAVVFGDKIDADNNQIINVAAPTDAGHATNKTYVDNLIANISTDAITEGDSEVAIADLGTGTVGITVDGTQRFALSATALSLTVPVSVNGDELATKAYVDTAEADANTYTDGQIAALDFNNVDGGIAVTGGAVSLGTNADLLLDSTSELQFSSAVVIGDDPDAAGSPAVCASSFRPISGQADLNLSPGTGGNIALSSAGDVTYGGVGIVGDDPDSAGQPAVCASSFRPVSGQANLSLRPGTGGAIDLDGGDVTYGGVGIVGDDADNAGNPAVCASTFRPVSGQTDLNVRAGSGGAVTFGDAVLEGVGTPVAGTDATNKTYVDTYADQAEADAISTAAADATSKADAAEAAAVATAAADATAKANAAEAAANTYTDSAVAGLVDSAPGTLDTLNELAAALGDDANFSTTVTNSIATKLAPSDLTNFHSAVTTITSTQSATNASGTLGITFGDLTNAVHYNIYLNRLLLRPSEYSVSGTTVTFNQALLATDDELEITGMHASV